ncbi:MAG TPA: 2'-5' RNA ligase family protein, partial [Pseudonocardiaceae bacterium]
RLFSAFRPSEAAVAHLARAFRAVALPSGVRPTPAERWHLTLGFYGNEASVPERADHLDTQLAGLAPPTLRLAGAGTFPGVLWVGVQPATAGDREALRRIAVAAGAGRRYQAHVTVARWRLDRPTALMVGQLASYAGPTWTADRVDLVHSEPGGAHTTVHSVPLSAW